MTSNTLRFQRIPKETPREGDLVKTEFIKPEWIDSGAASEKGCFFYNNPEKNVQVGYWSCSAFSETITFPYDEFGVVLRGRLELIDADGKSDIFSAGDIFFIPRGSKTTWRILDHLEQYYMIYAPRDTQYYEF